MGKKIEIWTDFDGTITRTDFGHIIISRYGTNRKRFLEIEKMVEKGSISLKEGLVKEYSLVRMTEKQMFHLAKQVVEVDTYFREFMAFTGENHLSVTVLSDGFRNYIEFILDLHGINLNQLTIKANEVRFRKDRLKLSFPHASSSCQNCANCKREHIEKHKAADNETFMIYAGDGLSDLYGSRAVDHVFARENSTLERYLKNRNLPHDVFRDFRDIISGISAILRKEEANPGYLKERIAQRTPLPFPCEIEAV
ncbi:MAG: MtnX-like HAD-IB family phosphatase [Candidatus Hodarchaeales archaeon]